MKIEKIYTSTLTLLIAHQIDAAYWKEWEMFLLPGGIQFFDLFNLGIVPALIWGLRSVILLEKKGFIYSLFTSLLGVLTFLIHLGFFIFGFKQFNLPISIAIIVLCMLSATIQLLYTLKQKEIFKN
jgi:hypothetical protein